MGRGWVFRAAVGTGLMTQAQPWPEHLAGLLPPDGMLKEQYEVTGFLGEGGFGAVFAGVQHPLDRPVAIKVMFPGHSPAVRTRFLREAQAAAGLHHPNVVTVFDYGLIDQRRPFIVMELLKGVDLGSELREGGPMERARALGLFMPCLEALFEAHERGLVHRDVKPENLFLSQLPRGREVLRILDFGIARMIDADPEGSRQTPSAPRLTPTGQKVGTPHYLSPEYFESGMVTPALDVYAMGLVLAEMISGSPVVQAENLYGYVIRHIRGELNFAPGLLSDPLMPVLRRATARNLEDRYPDAGAFLEGLEGALERPSVMITSGSLAHGAVTGSMSDVQLMSHAHSPTQAIPDGFVYVRPEPFLMGSPMREPGREVDEAQRPVVLTRGFLMQQMAVTQGQWSSLMGNDPSCFKGESRPVDQVNWYDALAYCNALSERDGLEPSYRFVGVSGTPGGQFSCKKVVFAGLASEGWRLPTEA